MRIRTRQRYSWSLSRRCFLQISSEAANQNPMKNKKIAAKWIGFTNLGHPIVKISIRRLNASTDSVSGSSPSPLAQKTSLPRRTQSVTASAELQIFTGHLLVNWRLRYLELFTKPTFWFAYVTNSPFLANPPADLWREDDHEGLAILSKTEPRRIWTGTIKDHPPQACRGWAQSWATVSWYDLETADYLLSWSPVREFLRSHSLNKISAKLARYAWARCTREGNLQCGSVVTHSTRMDCGWVRMDTGGLLKITATNLIWSGNVKLHASRYITT